MIHQRIQDDIKKAMKARDSFRLGVLRYVHSEIKNVTINQKTEITDEITLQIVSRLAKQRHDGIGEFTKAGRSDLAEKEKEELAILETYLPRQLSEEEIRQVVKEVIEESGATSRRELGKVMKASLERLAGQASGKRVQSIASSLLT